MTDDDRTPDAATVPDWARLARLIAEPLADREAAGTGAPPASALAVLADVLRAPTPPAPTTDETERALASVLARRSLAPSAPRVAVAPSRPRWRPLAWSLAAAALLMAVGIRWLVDGGASAHRAARSVAPALTHALATGVGRVDSLRLPDGTRVILGPSSALDIAARFARGEREVRVRGEAFFDVAHDAAHPFIVRTSQATLRDVGTSFGVTTGAGTGTSVAVHEGVVAMRGSVPGGAEQRLGAGDRGEVDDAGTVRVLRGAVTDDDLAWTRGRLVLRDAAVPDVAAELRRWYGVTLRVDDPALAARRVTASFAGGTGADAARVVASALGGTASVAGDTVWVVAATLTPP